MGNSLFGMMNHSTSGMMLSQIGINTTSQNVLNAKTVGYSRQRVLAASCNPIYYKGQGYLGTGVYVRDVQRFRDMHLEKQIHNSLSDTNATKVQTELLPQLEAVFKEGKEVGFSHHLKEFWNGLEELSKDPTNPTMQTLVIENTQNLTSEMNHLVSELKEQLAEIEARQNDQLSITTGLIQSIQEVNQQILKATQKDPTKTPNNLLDQRDDLVQELSTYLPITATYKEDGTVQLSTTYEDGTLHDVFMLNETQLKTDLKQLTSGSLKGLSDTQQMIENDIIPHLNEWSLTMANEVNAIQGFDFFKITLGDEAGTLSVNEGLLDGTVSMKVGVNGINDNSLVLEMLALRDETFTINGKNATFSQSHQSLVSQVGTTVRSVESRHASNESMLEILNAKYQSISGVNTDEEAVALVQYQSCYDANAKVISTIADMLDTIINRMGV